MKSARIFAPKLGGGSICDAGISSTADTVSTSRPMSWAWPSALAASMITTQLRRLIAEFGRPKRADKSTTGTTAPRRLITPRTKAGIIGTTVRLPYSMISLMHRMPMANISVPSMNVRYCASSSTARAV
ncbi:hypothetical protein D3C78_1578450 [compost metagenome]